MPSRLEILNLDEPPAAPAGESPWVIAPSPREIRLEEYDPEWPVRARAISERVSAVLGPRALRIEHVGSTAVPGLIAKPIIDLDLTVADPDDERGWLPPLQEAGFVLTVREPWWQGHRLLCDGHRAAAGRPEASVEQAFNVHVFGPDSPELVKHLIFRNWLRASPDDRDLYAAAKRSAADGAAQHVMDYNARKQTVIHDIYRRAFRAAGFLD